MRTVALSLVLALGVFALDETKEFKSPKGWWTLRGPDTWVMRDAPDANFEESVAIGDPSEPNIALRVQINDVPLELGALVDVIKGQLEQEGISPENESELTLNGRDAIQYEILVKGPQGTARVRQVLVAAGNRKAVLTVALGDPAPEGRWKEFERVFSTFTLVEGEAARAEWKPRTFDHLGLTIELPAEGELEEYPSEVEITWKEQVIHFMAGCERREGPLEKLVEFDMAKEPHGKLAGPPEILSQEAVSADAGKAILLRIKVTLDKVGPLITSAVYLRAHGGEVWILAVATLGNEIPEGFKRFEEAFLKAKVARSHLAAAATTLPELSDTVKAWGGAADLAVPEGWASYRTRKSSRDDEGPMVQEKEGWGAEGATDLGLVAEHGTIEGGQEAYGEWLVTEHKSEVCPSKFAKARPIDVGGKKGVVWELEIGPESDRRVRKAVVVFDGAEYWEIRNEYSVGAASVYGPLAEQVASKVQWK